LTKFRPSEAQRARLGAAIEHLGPDVAVLDGPEPFAVRRHPDRPWGPVMDLYAAIYALDPRSAHFRVRRRVLIDRPETPLDRATCQVVGKKLAQVAPLPGSEAIIDLTDQVPTAPVAPLPSGPPWMQAARDLAPVGEGKKAVRDRAIGAVLVHDGAAIAAARNRAGLNRVFHAEVCLVQNTWPVPAGSTLYVGLQCCRMCAALIVAASTETAVVYDQADPGRLAQGTALQALGWERQASTA